MKQQYTEAELIAFLKDFVFEMKQSTRHAACLGAGPPLDPAMVYKDASNLLELVEEYPTKQYVKK